MCSLQEEDIYKALKLINSQKSLRENLFKQVKQMQERSLFLSIN